MPSASEQQAAELFIAVLDQDPAGRSSFLDRACMNDPGLRSRVEDLLSADARDTVFLEPPIQVDGRGHGTAVSVGPGTVIGQFEVLRAIGAGGMGVVYEARQKRPNRIVALKLMSMSMIEQSARRRFEHEAEIMARLHHPGIAQVYEAGVYDERMPWFAMEHIAGARSLRDYAKDQALGHRAVLNLFVKVCDAVHYAHQHGVIHRDLKPANILVNAEGQPKIIDFGVARLAEADVASPTMHTRAGQMIGTPRYMSPEQCAGPSAGASAAYAIDLRSDVYTLGVILYELLTGVMPYDLEGKSLVMMAQMIGHAEPRPPSSFDRTLVGDLEIILLKTLEKEPTRRYQSALELADDLRRYFAGDPILARQASAFYVLRKSLRRYRVAAMFVLLTLLGLGAFAVYASLQAKAKGQLALKEQTARQAAQKAEGVAAAAQKDAEHKAKHAQAVTAFFVKTLGWADPDITQSGDMSMNQMLRRASSEVGTAFSGDRQAEAEVHLVVGRAFATHGESDLAEIHLRRALELLRADPATRPDQEYEILWVLQFVRHDTDAPDQYQDRNEIEDIGCRIIERSHPEVAAALSDMHRLTASTTVDVNGSNAARLRAIELAQTAFQPDDPLWLIFGDQLQSASYSIGYGGRNPGLACEYLRSALEALRRVVPETNFRVARTRAPLISYTITDGKYADAEVLSRQAIADLQRQLPDDHWYIGTLQRFLGQSLRLQHRLHEAEPVLLDGLLKVSRGPHDTNQYARAIIRELIYLYDDVGQADKALEYRRRLALAFAKNPFPCDLVSLRYILGPDRAALHESAARLDKLLPKDSHETVAAAIENCMTLSRSTLSPDDPLAILILDVMAIWADGYRLRDGSTAVTKPVFEQALAVDTASPIRHPGKQATTLLNLALRALSEGHPELAESFARRGAAIIEIELARWPNFVGAMQSLLGQTLLNQRRFEEAEPALLRGLELLHAFNPDDSNTVIAETRLRDLYAAWDRPAEAEQYAVSIANRALRLPPNGSSLNSAAWRIVIDARYSTAAYEVALQAAEKAVGLERGNGGWVNTLGVAQYRLGRFEQALKTLTESDALNDGKYPTEAAFLAMIHWRNGNHERARQELTRLREGLQSPDINSNENHRRFLREAEKMITP